MTQAILLNKSFILSFSKNKLAPSATTLFQIIFAWSHATAFILYRLDSWYTPHIAPSPTLHASFYAACSLQSVPGCSKKLLGCRRVQNICRRSPIRRRKMKACQSKTSVLWLCFKVSRTVRYSLFLCPEKEEWKKFAFPPAHLLDLMLYLCSS